MCGRGACMAVGGVHGGGGHCVVGGMCGRRGMHSGGGGMHGGEGACMVTKPASKSSSLQ